MTANVAAVVCAAGESSRMGRSKPLLPIGDETFLGHLLKEIKASQINETFIVLGYQPQVVIGAMPEIAPITVINPNYTLGQLSSLQVGLREVGERDAIIMCLADHPFITTEVIDSLIAAFESSGAPIVVPTLGGRRGHPTLFARSTFQELLDAPLDQGARVVVQAHAEEVLEVPTEEAGILADIDTPEQYEVWLATWNRH